MVVEVDGAAHSQRAKSVSELFSLMSTMCQLQRCEGHPSFQALALLGNSGDLLCFKGMAMGDTDQRSLVVCNPLTESWRILRSPPTGVEKYYDESVVLVFDETAKSF